MADARQVVASAARTTSGDSGAISVAGSSAEQINLLADVTVVSGTTPSMAVSIEWSHDATNFAAADPVDAHGVAITAALKRVKSYAVKGPTYRVVWAITGTTPSFTFAVSEHLTT